MTSTIPLWQAIAVTVVVWVCLGLLIVRAWYLLCEFGAVSDCDQEAAPLVPARSLSTTNHSVARSVPDHTVADEFRTWEWPVERFVSPAHTVRRGAN
jgi:hypothetical protein